MRIGLIIPLLCAGLLAQTCTIHTPTSCGTTGVWAGPPTLESSLAGAASSLPAAGLSVTTLPQPRMVLSANLVPAGRSYMTSDPNTCGGTSPSGICYYNVTGAYASTSNGGFGILGYLYSLTAPKPFGAGLGAVDINIWLGPFFTASQWAAACASYGGGSCSPSIGSANSSWYTNSLATYDALFAKLSALGLKVRLAPEISADVRAACGIGSGAGNFTETQVQNCLAPLEATLAARYSAVPYSPGTIEGISVLHEPCGVSALAFGTGSSCFLSVVGVDTLIAYISAAVKASSLNTKLKTGAGAVTSDLGGTLYTCPNPNNYWCDWVTNLTGSLDYYSVHTYAGTATPWSGFDNTLAIYAAMAAAVPSVKQVIADESGPLEYAPLTGGLGEGGAYVGCGYKEWSTDGTFSAWVRWVVGNWAPANRLSRWTLFPSEPIVKWTTDINNTHCYPSSDNYDPWLSQYYGSVTPEGLQYGVVAAGWNTSLQGSAHLTGRVHLGH